MRLPRDSQSQAARVLARSEPEIVFPHLCQDVLYPPVIALVDGYLRSRHSVGDLELPNFRAPNETVAVFSDYGGDHHDSSYVSYSFLLMAYNYRDILRDELVDIRRRHGLDSTHTTIEFKKLGYDPVRRALPSYLQALDSLIAGWLITVVVNKAIATLMGVGGTFGHLYISKVLNDAGVSDWKPHVAERMLRIVHLASYLAALAVPDKTKVFWMTDDDAIVPNTHKAAHTMSVFNSLLPEYTDKIFPRVGWTTPFPDRNCMLHHDLLSAADLAAGALSAYFSSGAEKKRSLNRAQPIYEWLARRGSGLRKTAVLIDKADEHELQISGLEVGSAAFQ